MPAAARVTDAHSCPMSTPTPHVGGVITGPGSPSVKIGHAPAATVGSICACGLGPPNLIALGSTSVQIDRKPAARVGDLTSHGGKVACGCLTVLIG